MKNTTSLVKVVPKKLVNNLTFHSLEKSSLNSGIMSGSDSGKPIMLTDPDSASADAFRTSAKNIAAQCSILAAKLQEEMEAESNPESQQQETTNPPPQVDAGQALCSSKHNTSNNSESSVKLP